MNSDAIANGLELVAPAVAAFVGAFIPGAPAWIMAALKLASGIARAGGTPQDITHIDAAALAKGRAAADARLDERAELRDYRVEARNAVRPPETPPPDTEPSIYDELGDPSRIRDTEPSSSDG